MFQAKFVETIKTYISGSKTFFFENLSVYAIILKNMVEAARRSQMAARHGACALHAG
jgi:hypothetical protein